MLNDINIFRAIISRRSSWAGHVAGLQESRTSFKILTGKYTGQRPQGRARQDNIRMNIKKIGVSMRNWIDSSQDKDYWRALVNVALNLRIA